MEKTKIILVRHGESLGNARRMLLGHTDLDLSELGYRQAEACAEALKNEKVDAIYSSDLLRAYNTAIPHAKMRGLAVQKSLQLREIYLGAWEGKSVADILEKHADMYEKDWLGAYGTFRFPGGESTVEAGERFYAEVARISEENEGKTVLIAAHAAVIRSFFAKVLGIAPEDIAPKLPFPSNASYSEVCFNGRSFEAGRFSVDDYLADIGITKYGA
ncbi:MAG: histidine phosphatase family protein [Clostridia bacterium]|nr:histidine phosphatase family protein [Clostridia bacterium]